MRDESLDGPSESVKVKQPFFAIDVRSFARALSVNFNAGVGYMVQASGAGGDQVTTSWSSAAVERYTKMSRGRAKQSTKDLIDHRLLQQTADGTKPRYRVRPWAEVLEDFVGKLPISTRRAFRAVVAGEPVASKDQGGQSHLERLGWTKNGALTFLHDPAPKHAWLPRAFVCGTKAGEESPLSRLRRIRDAALFRFVVDLYFEQQMAEFAGIPRNVLRVTYGRHKLGTFGLVTVWGFSTAVSDTYTVRSARPIENLVGTDPAGETDEERRKRLELLWDSLKRLESIGILEWVPHLFESDDFGSESIHPIAWGDGDAIEDQLGQLSREAALAMAERHGCEWLAADKFSHLRLVAMPSEMTDIQLISVARMRYRANTRPNEAWSGRSEASSQDWIRIYREIIARSLKYRQTIEEAV